MENSRSLGAVILAMQDWFGPPRLAKYFRRAGFRVTSLSFRASLVARADVDAAVFLPDGASDEELLAATKKVLIELRPNIVVPGDDLSVEFLQALAHQPAIDEGLAVLLRDSLGEVRHRATLRSRNALAALASRIGLRTPAQATVHTLAEALSFAEAQGWPAVFKAEESCAGFGVAICNDEAALRAAFARLGARSRGQALLAQSFIAGRTAMRAVIAWRGRVLAGISALKLETHPRKTGPSSVVEVIEHSEMDKSANALVEELGFSGFASLDFQLDEAGAAHLIELNPRPVPICHLGHYFDSDLCVALRRAITGEAVDLGPPRGVPRKVAMFPQEWIRCKDSPHFADAIHDVPWDEPDLISGLVQEAVGQMSWSKYDRGDEQRQRLRALLETAEARGEP